jgi:RNA polymerase sigma-70 factor, ECF subfamily
MADLADRFYWKVLVVRCQVGDRLALEEMVGQCQPRLRGFLHKMLPGGQNLDDLAQEVWMDVFRDLPRLADPGAFLPWFYRIARNRVFRTFRRRSEPIGSIQDMNVAPAREAEPDFSAEDAQAVHAALDQLSPEHREVLLLCFMEEMSYDQIASVVDCPIGTVRSRIHSAKRELRKIVERQAKHDHTK